jgi:N-methylhydantoinase B
MNEPTSGVDALSLQVFANLFSSVAEEMGATLQRASYSPNIKMRRDFSCAIFDAEGQMLAQAAHMPVHLGAMPMAMEAVRSRYELAPGDVVILNDPYEGGTHLPDVSLVSASYESGRPVGYVMSRAHHADIGGMSPGSMPLSTEIYQEGIIIPPLLLMKAGEVNEALLELILRNVRTPEERRGDFAAQLSAQRIGEAGLGSLVERYGLESVTAHGSALQSYSETMMRRVIESVPAGGYRFTDFLDDDGQGSGPVRIDVAVMREADSTDLEIDFTGSDQQQAGSINAVRAVTVSACLYVMRCLHTEDVPVNAGSLAPLKIVTPPASVVAAAPPAAVAGGNVETSQRIVDVIFGALAQALPDRVPAASQGTMNNLAFGGFDSKRKRPFAYYETMGGGQGARPGSSGMSAVHDHMSNTLNTPVEALESELPIRVRSYSLREGTGGDGQFKGGNGLRRDVLFLEPATVTILSERRQRRPYGLSGGAAGAVGENWLSQSKGDEKLDGKVTREVVPGDRLSVRTPGGGGLGEAH